MSTEGGEIVEVEGGHIIRSTGKKDRHSKVYTLKGPRDRRVRLSAHTAIEFYDVQDRLGYDRPSKAVDWLIKKAKSSIDKLAEIPPWHPLGENKPQNEQEQQNIAANSSTCLVVGESSETNNNNGYGFHLLRQLSENQGNNDYNVETENFHNYRSENLGLSLHSFQDQDGYIPWQSSQNQQEQPCENQNQNQNQNQTLFENQYQRIVNWNNETTKLGFMVNSNSFLGQGSAGSEYSPNETLESSFPHSVRAWNEIPMDSSSEQHHQRSQQGSIFGNRFVSDGLAGFCIPEEDHKVSSNRPNSTSPPNLN